MRGCCSILWVANPGETSFFIQLLLQDLGRARAAGVRRFEDAPQAGTPAALYRGAAAAAVAEEDGD